MNCEQSGMGASGEALPVLPAGSPLVEHPGIFLLNVTAGVVDRVTGGESTRGSERLFWG